MRIYPCLSDFHPNILFLYHLLIVVDIIVLSYFRHFLNKHFHDYFLTSLFVFFHNSQFIKVAFNEILSLLYSWQTNMDNNLPN